MEHSIKETKEFILGATEAIKFGKGVRNIVREDKLDPIKAFELVKDQFSKVEIYSAAIKDADKIKDELKNLSKEEMVELFLELVSAVSEVEKA